MEMGLGMGKGMGMGKEMRMEKEGGAELGTQVREEVEALSLPVQSLSPAL